MAAVAAATWHPNRRKPMTERQSPATAPPHAEPGAHDAPEHVLGSLHRHGFLHLATEVVTALGEKTTVT